MEICLSATHISKSYNRNQVLNGISLDVQRGTMVGIEGENGSGKSTLLNILAGFRKPDRGTIVIKGTVGFCPQEPLLFPAMTVTENLAFFARAYGLPPIRPGTVGQARIDQLLQRLRFGEKLTRRCSVLSGGTIQKLNLITALLHDPDILLLDEPYAAFDWDTYLAFWEYARELREEGKTLIIISHILYDRNQFTEIKTIRGGRLL